MAAIGVLHLELRIEEAQSLKEKRHVIKGLQERLRNRFNVAVAEIDYQDLWQRSLLSVVTIASDQEPAAKVLQSAEREAFNLVGRQLVRASVEWIE